MRQLAAVSLAILFTLHLPGARASESAGDGIPAGELSPEALFETGRHEVTINSGVLFSPFIASRNRPVINYTITEVQFGYMLMDVKGGGILRGNFEIVGEGFGSAIFQGPGSYIAGVTVWGRYNFVRPTARLIPFAQAGMGVTGTDLDNRIVGQVFNFNLDVGVGLRWLVARQWAMNLEYRYQHVSNANSGRHNLGINAHGPMLGVSYLF